MRAVMSFGVIHNPSPKKRDKFSFKWGTVCFGKREILMPFDVIEGKTIEEQRADAHSLIDSAFDVAIESEAYARSLK